MNISQIGNRFSVYFTEMGLAFRDGKDFTDTCFNDKSDPLYNYLPHFLPIDKDVQVALQTVPQKAIDEIKYFASFWGSWGIKNDDDLLFWTYLKPTAHRILSDMFIKLGLDKKTNNLPIIHFRCSDVPFERNPHYRVQRFDYYKDSLNELKHKGINASNIFIMYNNGHLSSKEQCNTCDSYVEMLRDYLFSIGTETHIISGSNIEDFAKLFYSPAVISTGSSFSFISAFLGNGYFITTPTEIDTKCKKCHWIKSDYMIFHEDVKSYYDLDEMRYHFNRSSS
jgi:hypothetical protein